MSKQATLDFVHQFVPGNSSRTLLLLHGTGGNENDLISLGRALDPTDLVLSGGVGRGLPVKKAPFQLCSNPKHHRTQ
jgi:hypothetical protein